MELKPYRKLVKNPLWSQLGPDYLPGVKQAHGHVSAGKLDAAIGTLTELLLDNQHPNLYRLLALCYRSADEPAEADVMEELASHHEQALRKKSRATQDDALESGCE